MHTLYEPWDFHPGLHAADLSNLIRLVPSIAIRLEQLAGKEPASYLGDVGWGGLTKDQIMAAREGLLYQGDGEIDLMGHI